MNKTKALAVILCLTQILISCTSKPTIATQAHTISMSHNDYLQDSPLFGALSKGINCVEVDLFLKDGALCVAHTADEIKTKNTLESLYLNPLKDIIAKNGGKVYSSSNQEFYLYLNFKEQGEIIDQVNQVLEKYSDIISYYDVDGYHPAPIKVIGAKWHEVKHQTKRYMFAEGDAEFLDSQLPASAVFMINDDWSRYFTWQGEGEMPINEELHLREMVHRAHKKGRIIRFWDSKTATGNERLAIWNKLRECGVDLISSGDLSALQQFATSQIDAVKLTPAGIIETKMSGNGISIAFNNKNRIENGTHNLGSTDNNSVKNINLKNNIAAIVGTPSGDKPNTYNLTFNSVPEFKTGIASRLFGDWESWTKPYPFKELSQFPSDKVEFSIWQYNDGMYAVMVPLSDNNYVSMLGTDKNGLGAIAQSYSSKTYNQVPFMIIGFDHDPHRLVTDVYNELMNYIGSDNNLRKYKDYPTAFEGLTWCTWNAMYEDVSEAKIANAIETFADKGVTIPTLLIDDGWLDITDTKRLRSHEFDKAKFPNGSKPVFDMLRSKYGVNDIGVWHTMNGYWSGIDEKSELYAAEKANIIEFKDKESVHDKEVNNIPYYAPSPVNQKAFNFYDKWYSYLKDQGVTFVKVDQQSVIKRLAKGHSNPDLSYAEVAKNMEQSLQRAVRKHFNGQIINCQDMATEALYNMGSSAILRNSDDFFPERTAFYSIENEKGNAAVHALMNVHNALWISEIAWPDYDMFQTHHGSAEYHAALRAISGGPVFLTDVPGKQNIDIAKSLCLKNGEIIRLEVPGKPTEDCIFNVNIKEPLKVFAMHKNVGYLSAFNADNEANVKGDWSVADIEGLKGNNFVAYEYGSKAYKFINRADLVPLSLDKLKYEYWNVVPMQNNSAVIGLVDKLNSAAAVVASVIRPNKISTIISEGGKVAFALPNAPKRISVNGKDVNENDWSFSDNILILTTINNGENINITIDY